MNTLRELEAHFIKHVVGIATEHHGKTLPDGTTQWGGFEIDEFHRVDTLEEAQGIWFDCPLCFTANNGPVGTHGVQIWFEGRNVPERLGFDGEGKKVRWNVSGSSLDDLVLTPSILLKSGCNWHGFVGSSGIPPGCAG